MTDSAVFHDSVSGAYRDAAGTLDIAEGEGLPDQTSESGKWLKTVGGAAVWTTLSASEVSGLGTAATHAATDFDASGAAATAQAASQPLDADLTTLAGLGFPGGTTDFLRADASWATPPGGSGDVAGDTHAAASKATPVDADEIPLVDSAASYALKKLTWANLKATLKAYTDTLYTAIGASASPNGSAGGDLTGTYPNPTLAAAGGGAAGPTGSATVVPIVTVDAKGRVTALTSATAAPTNAAGGDLAGNYPNPTVAALAITDAKVATANKDGTAATASMRTLGTGAAQAAAGNDSRLSDARTPTAHASTHKPGGTDALMTVVRDAGTSTSGTATTQVAAISAAASTQLVDWQVIAAQTNAASTQIKVIITYSDATTTTITTTAATASTILGNAGGLLVSVAGALSTSPALVVNSAKAVTGIRVETAGTGTGSRGAAVSATQVPL